MNLLPYVIAFLMVLSAITYSRIHSTNTLIPSSLAFQEYVQASEKYSYELWMKKYDDATVKEVNSKKNHFVKGSSKLNLKPIFLGSAAAEKKKAYRELLGRIINQLYCDEPYFKAAMEEDPLWVDHLLDAMENAKVSSAKELNKLDLKDPFLNTMLYHLLKENKSLLKYCSFDSYEQLSVYLAPKELLLIVFQDQSVADEIHKERGDINKKARNKGDMEELKKEFESLKQRFPTPYDAYLTYDISKTYIKP